ncbi:hypothetical protein [Citricoccus nitrophenolicus]|uniref:hypothetical protein n=1 Tax=Citricoccus nitrophenolicus TaxID=863575 RepID=UPI0039B541F4
MVADADALLVGPRGRRLCLEMAMDLSPEVRVAAFWLAHDLDPGKGTSRVMLKATFGEASEPPPRPSMTDLITALAALDVTMAGAEVIDRALARAVDTSRPWQEPDGEDALAALPEVRKALAPIAQHVITSPSTKWWSFPQGTIQSLGQIPLGLNLIEDSFGWEHATVIPVRGIGRTSEVRAEADWVALCLEHPLEVTASRRHDWFRCTGYDGRWVIPDCEKVAERWDAVHLTALAYLSNANRALHVDTDLSTVIAGWNPDTTIWLTDAAREWDNPRQEWQRSPDQENWASTTH